MEHQNTSPQKSCVGCGRYFRPDNRVGNRQKSCGKLICNKKRQKASQTTWHQNNPDYFHGRYAVVKEWRQTHPDYQKDRRRAKKQSEIQTEFPPPTPIGSIRYNLRTNFEKGEIQTLVLTLIQRGQGLRINGARIQPARDTNRDGNPTPLQVSSPA